MYRSNNLLYPVYILLVSLHCVVHKQVDNRGVQGSAKHYLFLGLPFRYSRRGAGVDRGEM